MRRRRDRFPLNDDEATPIEAMSRQGVVVAQESMETILTPFFGTFSTFE
jgi:hypothetical protein